MDYSPNQHLSPAYTSNNNNNCPAVYSNTLPPPPPTSAEVTTKVGDLKKKEAFEASLCEVYQFKQCISLKIQQLEQAIGRLKSLVLVYGDSEVEAGLLLPNKMAADQLPAKSSAKAVAEEGTRQTNGGLLMNHSTSSASSSPSSADLLELRTILTDIDQHLAVLKDVEERHAHICESYSQEIRARDETLQSKVHQILTLSQELALQQAKINQLTFQNKKLESEINLVRNATPSLTVKTPVDSSSKSPKPPSSPVGGPAIASEETNKSDYLIDLETKRTPTPPPSPAAGLAETETEKEIEAAAPAPAPTSTSVIAGRNYEEMYFKLLEQYHSGEHLPTKSAAEICKPVAASQVDHPLPSSSSSRGLIDIEEGLGHKATSSSMSLLEKKKKSPATGKELKGKAIDELEDDDDATADLEQNELAAKLRDVEKQKTTLSTTKPMKKATLGAANQSSVPRLVEQQEQKKIKTEVGLNAIKEEASLDDEEVIMEQEEKQALLANFEKSKKFLKEHKLADKVISSEIASPVAGEEIEVTRTSKSVYEHFLHMQKDLQKLVRSEERLRVRCQELEIEMEQLREAKEDDEYKLSEATYELDILKHNYDLEMESFGSAVTERESLIEKLQQKVEALKRKYMTLDQRLQESINKEVGYKSQIEEAEGRVRYEQLQKQTMIDARVNELELALAAAEGEHQAKTAELKRQLAEREAKEAELNGRIEELEETLKNLVINNGGAGGNGDMNVAVEDEFAYYKNRIDALLKEVEVEKQMRNQAAEKFEDELKGKEKVVEQLKEQNRKEKELFIREKNDIDSRFRKLATKFKVKEREIATLQEKLVALNEKFKPRSGEATNGELGSMESMDETLTSPSEAEKSPEQLMIELTLQEAALVELRTKLENAEDALQVLNGTLQKERDRRRELESHYLGQMKGRGRSRGFLRGALGVLIGGGGGSEADGSDEWSPLEDTNQLFLAQPYSPGLYPYHNGPHHRNSTASLSLLMEESSGYSHHIYGGGFSSAEMLAEGGGGGDLTACSDSFLESLGRLLRRQKNAFLFGSRKEKTLRISFLVYLLLIHFYAFEYYVG